MILLKMTQKTKLMTQLLLQHASHKLLLNIISVSPMPGHLQKVNIIHFHVSKPSENHVPLNNPLPFLLQYHTALSHTCHHCRGPSLLYYSGFLNLISFHLAQDDTAALQKLLLPYCLLVLFLPHTHSSWIENTASILFFTSFFLTRI